MSIVSIVSIVSIDNKQDIQEGTQEDIQGTVDILPILSYSIKELWEGQEQECEQAQDVKDDNATTDR